MGKLRVAYVAFMFFSAVVLAEQPLVPGASAAAVPEAAYVKSVLRQPEQAMNLAEIKLDFDRFIDPSVDVAANMMEIDEIVQKILVMSDSSSSDAKLVALKTYLYMPGPWNGFRAYEYDLDDPFGHKLRNKLLSQYLRSRRGNCVTMPVLFMILGQRLGLDVTLSTAPQHLFVKYTDPNRRTINLETTSGANPARDVWLRKGFPMTDEAISNGIYLRKLSKRESVAIMATTIAEHFSAQNQPEKTLALSDVILEYHPREVGSMIKKGSAYARLLKRDFVSQYPTPAQIPFEKWHYYKYLEHQNRHWYEKAEALGWREPDLSLQVDYLQATASMSSTNQ